ncbi:hypothetical protein [Actinopolyspora mortivallis]|uniref:hypothetical protein n=1 Tax=Actinopolyspora mortivallis TaxID=33906 RepID=UPI001C62C556|nr:hypothetical protein [Actinopolyspora mortivallis]
MLVTHIVSAGAWIGVDVVLAVLVFTAMFAGSVRVAAVSYQALEIFAVWSLLATGLVCLVSGVVLGLGTKYGLLRYWWVVVKLAVNLVFVVLVPLGLLPSVTAAAEYARGLEPGDPVVFAVNSLAFPRSSPCWACWAP